MKLDLKQALTQYKNCTLDLIASLEREDFNSLDGLLNKRQLVIDTVDNISYTKEEFTAISEELQILVLQKKLTDLMNEKKKKVRRELDNVIEGKKANKNYNRTIYSDSTFFSKQI